MEDGPVREAEALLAGGARHGYPLTQVPVPAWTEVNWLAHADPALIGQRVRYESGLHRPQGTWAWATGLVARELLDLAAWRPELVVQLQRECLVPIELWLLERDHHGLAPDQFVSVGIERLRSHPRDRRTP